MSNKHPKCECGTTKYDYFKKVYRNGTLHMFRKCPSCQKVAQNALRQDEYDGKSLEKIALELGVSPRTVMRYLPGVKWLGNTKAKNC